ncbi:MAG: hypothetical protein IV094_17370 [Vitreoscilla sp.]|jgi:hypothetical protein|nr:hypothetical protein [Vitreoscilla sp.]
MRSLLGPGASSAPALREAFRRGPAAMLQRASAWLAECHREGALHCPLAQRHPADTANAASGVIESETERMAIVRMDTPV